MAEPVTKERNAPDTPERDSRIGTVGPASSGAVPSGRAREIAEHAARITVEQGPGNVTMRAVGEAAGVAPSVVAYHFGSREGLLSAVRDILEEETERWQRQRLAVGDEWATQLLCPATWVAATACDYARTLGGHFISLQWFYRTAGREESGESDARQRARAAMERDRDFWIRLQCRWSIDTDTADVHGLLAQGIIPYAMLEPDLPRREALIQQVFARLADRLAGRATIRRNLPLPPTDSKPASQARSAAQQSIIEAAIRIIAEQGLERLTHRRIAHAAGLSLASTTYFYATKNDIILDAFKEINSRSVDRVISNKTPQRSFLSSVMLDENDREQHNISLMFALTQAAIRMPQLRPLALNLQQLRGIGALRWLHARGHAQADHLDGIIWASASYPVGEYALLLPPEERRAYLDAQSARTFDLIFASAGV